MKIEFVTDNRLALEYPPVPAKKLIPSWYKELSEHSIEEKYVDDAQYHLHNDIESTKTVRGCVPVLDYLTSGYIIRCHSQILITPGMLTHDQKSFWWKGSNTTVGVHSYSQCPVKLNDVKNTYMKYENCWTVKLPEGYSALFYQPAFFFEKRYTLFPAIVDCDVYHNPVLFPGVVNANESFYINPGDPVMAVFPFKRDEWISEARYPTDDEMKKPNKLLHYLHTKYKQLFHQKKSYK